MSYETSVSITGNFLHEQTRKEIIRRYCVTVEEALAEEAVAMIRAYLPTQYKRDRPDPHAGLYESMIHTERTVEDQVIVTDTPVVYGPWLEGEGSMNFPRTRFRGYHTFRIIAQRLEMTASEDADRELPPYLGELNV